MSNTTGSLNTPPRRQKAAVWWVLGGVGVFIVLTIVLAAIYAPSVTGPVPEAASTPAIEAPVVEAPAAAPDAGTDAEEPAAAE